MQEKELKVTPEDVEQLTQYIRQTGKPQTTRELARRYIEMLKQRAKARN